MYLNDLMKDLHMTRAELCRRSGIPDSTLRDILNGKAQIDHCEAGTLYCLAEALDTTVEDIIDAYWDESPDDEKLERKILHDSSPMHLFFRMVDITRHLRFYLPGMSFVEQICSGKWIEQFYAEGLYRCALFLLGLIDHICRLHGQERKAQYDKYRCCVLDEVVYSVRVADKIFKPAEYMFTMKRSIVNSVPELAKFFIILTEEDIAPLPE